MSDGSVYVDTNVLYMYLRTDPTHLSTIKTFLERVVRGEIIAFVGVLTLDELFYRLLLARVKEATGDNPLGKLRKDPTGAVASHSRAIETAIRTLMALPHIEPVGLEATDWERMLDNIRTFWLLPRDALHVAIIQRLGLTAIASDDVDFDRVEGIERHWVINPPAS